MKNLYKLLLILILLNFLVIRSYSQILELEKTYQISKEAKKGSLNNVSYDADKGIYTLSYVTKAKKTSTRIETYQFDKDFNFVKMDNDEMEFEKAKSTFKWWKLKSENYEVEGITADPNLSGTLVLRKIRLSYGFDWLNLRYYIKKQVLDKVKLKSEDGNKYYYHNSIEDDQRGELYVVCGVKDKNVSDSYVKNLHLLRINSNLEVVKDKVIQVDYPENCAFIATLFSEDEDFEGIVMILAPNGANKTKDPDNGNYTYLRLNANLEITEKIPFKSPSGYWKIDEIVRSGKGNDDDIYLFGPSAGKTESYFNDLVGKEKFMFVQLMKIKNKQLNYLTETNLGEFESKLKVPPSQSKSPSYRGKKFHLVNTLVTSKGELFITGQNWSTKYNVIQKEFRDVYGDILAFHFDNSGKLKAQYGYDTKENNEDTKLNGTPQDLIEGKDNVFWMVKETKGSGLMYPCIGKINANEGTINDFVLFGKKDYFLEPKFSYLSTEQKDKIVLFGTDKKGRMLWFARIKLE